MPTACYAVATLHFENVEIIGDNGDKAAILLYGDPVLGAGVGTEGVCNDPTNALAGFNIGTTDYAAFRVNISQAMANTTGDGEVLNYPSGTLPNGYYYLAIQGENGSLVKFDLRIEVDYQGTCKLETSCGACDLSFTANDNCSGDGSANTVIQINGEIDLAINEPIVTIKGNPALEGSDYTINKDNKTISLNPNAASHEDYYEIKIGNNVCTSVYQDTIQCCYLETDNTTAISLCKGNEYTVSTSNVQLNDEQNKVFWVLTAGTLGVNDEVGVFNALKSYPGSSIVFSNDGSLLTGTYSLTPYIGTSTLSNRSYTSIKSISSNINTGEINTDQTVDPFTIEDIPFDSNTKVKYTVSIAGIEEEDKLIEPAYKFPDGNGDQTTIKKSTSIVGELQFSTLIEGNPNGDYSLFIPEGIDIGSNMKVTFGIEILDIPIGAVAEDCTAFGDPILIDIVAPVTYTKREFCSGVDGSVIIELSGGSGNYNAWVDGSPVSTPIFEISNLTQGDSYLLEIEDASCSSGSISKNETFNCDPSNDCINNAISLNSQINATICQSGYATFACQDFDYNPLTDDQAPTADIVGGNALECGTSPFYDVWFNFDIDDTTPDLWLNIYPENSSAQFGAAIYSGTPSHVNSCGESEYIDCLVYEGCSIGENSGSSLDITGCGSSHTRLDLTHLETGIYHLRVWRETAEGEDIPPTGDFSICLESTETHPNAQDGCSFSGSMDLLEGCNDDSIINTDYTTTYPCISNAGILEGNGCDNSADFYNNTAFYGFEIDTEGDNCTAKVELTFENLMIEGGADAKVELYGPFSSTISTGLCDTPVLEEQNISNVNPLIKSDLVEGMYYFSIAGYKGALVQFDLKIEVNYNTNCSFNRDCGSCPTEPTFEVITEATNASPCANQSLTLTANVDVSDNYDYKWNAPDNTLIEQTQVPFITIDNPQTGNYTVIVTNGAGCSAEESITIDVSESLPVITASLDNCDTYTLDAGAGFETYQWSIGSNDSIIPVDNINGTYTVTVTNEQGCTGTSEHTIEGFEASAEIVEDGPICEGTIVNFIADGGVSYQWAGPNGFTSTKSNPSTIASLSNEGIYTVTVTDNTECTEVIMVDLTIVPNPIPTIETLHIGNDCTDSNYVLDAGAVFVAYQWSNEQTTQTIAGTIEGIYTITVTNNEGCTGTTSIEHIFYSPPSVEIKGKEVFCEENVVLTAQSEQAAYYDWSSGDSTETIAATNIGTYTITITDENGCTGSASHSIEACPPCLVELPADFLMPCNAPLVALVADTIIGTPNSYLWSTGESSQSIHVSQPGIYSLSIVGDNCESVDTIEVLPPLVLFSNIEPNPAEICIGDSIKLVLTEDFDAYNWSNGETTQSIIAQIGDYTVTVTNDEGCSGTMSVEVSEDDCTVNCEVSAVITAPTASICEGESVVLTASGGENFEGMYAWSNGDTGQTVDVSIGGTYTVTITDESNCTGTGEVTVEVNPLPIPSITGNTIVCPVDGLTSILYAAPMSEGYEYLWSNGAIRDSIEVSVGGVYTVTVTDENTTCSANTSVEVIENCEEVCTIETVIAPASANICEGDSIVLTASVENIEENVEAMYVWSNGETNQTILVNQVATYTVTVSNDICSISTNVTIGSLPDISLSATDSGTPCTSDHYVTLETIAKNWNTPTYKWSNNASTQTINVTQTESYTVTVTDRGGCSATDLLAVTVLSLPNPEIEGNLEFCEGSNTILSVIETYNNYTWSNGSSEQSINVNIAGTYTVTIQDDNDCTGTAEVTISEVDSLTPNVSGNDFCEGSSATLSVDEVFTTYTWSNGDSGQNIDVIIGGTYIVTVEDASGCTGTGEVTVSEVGILTPTVNGNDFCEGSNTTLSVDEVFTTYTWSNGDFGQEIDVTIAGTYTVTVEDASGCTGTGEVTVNEISSLTPTVNGGDFCEGSNATLSVPETFNTYTWSNGSSGETTSIGSTGIYSVTVTDSNGCSGLGSISVTSNCPEEECDPLVNFDLEDSYCLNTTLYLYDSLSVTADSSGSWYVAAPPSQYNHFLEDGILELKNPGEYTIIYKLDEFTTCSRTIDVADLKDIDLNYSVFSCEQHDVVIEITNPEMDWKYQWSNGDTDTSIATNINTTTAYTVTVTNEAGCTTTASTTVTIGELPNLDILFISNLNLGNVVGITQSDSITLIADIENVNEIPNYEWSTGETSETISVTPLETTTYTLQATLSNGCVLTTEVIVEVTIPMNCVDAVKICDKTKKSFISNGSGVEELENETIRGCLANSEVNSIWLKIQIGMDNPCDTLLFFTITPNTPTDKYSFAIYDSLCGNLDAPIRCTDFRGNQATGIGLDRYSTDDSEEWLDVDADGLLRPLSVHPEDVYYLLVNNHGDNDGFTLEWKDSEGDSPANLGCEDIAPHTISAEDEIICEGSIEFTHSPVSECGDYQYILVDKEGQIQGVFDGIITGDALITGIYTIYGIIDYAGLEIPIGGTLEDLTGDFELSSNSILINKTCGSCSLQKLIPEINKRLNEAKQYQMEETIIDLQAKIDAIKLYVLEDSEGAIPDFDIDFLSIVIDANSLQTSCDSTYFEVFADSIVYDNSKPREYAYVGEDTLSYTISYPGCGEIKEQFTIDIRPPQCGIALEGSSDCETVYLQLENPIGIEDSLWAYQCKIEGNNGTNGEWIPIEDVVLNPNTNYSISMQAVQKTNNNIPIFHGSNADVCDYTLTTPSLDLLSVDIEETCFENGDASLTAIVGGSIMDVAYQWSSGETTPQIEVPQSVTTKDYSVTVTGIGTNCVTTDSAYNVGSPDISIEYADESRCLAILSIKNEIPESITCYNGEEEKEEQISEEDCWWNEEEQRYKCKLTLLQPYEEESQIFVQDSSGCRDSITIFNCVPDVKVVKPNPSTGLFTVELTGIPMETPIRYAVFSFDRRLVLKSDGYENPSNQIFDNWRTINIDLDDRFPSGMYFVRFEVKIEGLENPIYFYEKLLKIR
ncbi:MAG: hypothetical protein ACPGVB_00010 [Chitinophagales bacterium]